MLRGSSNNPVRSQSARLGSDTGPSQHDETIEPCCSGNAFSTSIRIAAARQRIGLTTALERTIEFGPSIMYKGIDLLPHETSHAPRSHLSHLSPSQGASPYIIKHGFWVETSMEWVELLYMLHGVSGADCLWLSSFHHRCHFSSTFFPGLHGTSGRHYRSPFACTQC